MIKNFGVTGHSGADILIEVVKVYNPDALLTIFPANRPDNGKYEDELLPLAVERNMGVIAMKTVKHVKNSDQLQTPGHATAPEVCRQGCNEHTCRPAATLGSPWI